MTSYKVLSPMVGVLVGGKVQNFYAGGVVPSADKEDADRLVKEGHLEPFGQAKPGRTASRRSAPKPAVSKAPAEAAKAAAAPDDDSDGPDGPDGPVDSDEPSADGADGAPAKSGPGSGKAAWRDYAASVGVAVDESLDRDEIIQAVADAGKPTE